MPSADHLTRPGALGIIGYPLDRTASPAIHNTALRLSGIPWSYVALRVAPEDLRAAIRGFEATNVIGYNVTYPHKETIQKFLDEITPAAKQVGAVNTVWQTRTGWAGDNTDLHGFAAGLKPVSKQIRGASAIIFGAGGAARAAAYSLVNDFGINALMIVARSPKRSADFARWAERLSPTVAIDVASLSKSATWRPAWNAARLIVNATPVGMNGTVDRLVPSDIRFRRDQVAYDLIYGCSTNFLRRATRSGATAISGHTMLWQQAAKSFEIWTGRRFPLKRVQAEVRL